MADIFSSNLVKAERGNSESFHSGPISVASKHTLDSAVPLFTCPWVDLGAVGD